MILQVINSLNTGGAEKYVVEISVELKRLGQEVEVLVFDKQQSAFSEILRKEGIKICYTISPQYLSPLNLLTFFMVIWGRKYNVIHSHLTYAQLWLSIAGLFNIRSKKLFTTEHSNNNNRRRHKAFKLIDKFIYSKYRRVLCISESTRQSIIEWVSPTQPLKYVVVPNCVDISYFQKAVTQDRSAFGLSDQHKIIMMVGRMSEAKDQVTIIRAVESLDDNYRCVLVGDGQTKRNIQNAVKIEGKTILTGKRSNIAEMLKMCDIYVQSSNWEGLPTTVLEAMAAQKVVLGSCVSGVVDIVPQFQLFDKGNYQQLAQMISCMTSERIETIITEQNRILQDYSLNKVVLIILNYYSQ